MILNEEKANFGQTLRLAKEKVRTLQQSADQEKQLSEEKIEELQRLLKQQQQETQKLHLRV